MNEQEEKKLRDLLKASISPMNHELRRDLWPEMLRRLAERPVAVPWYDWALLALLALCFFFFSPGAIPVFLYHL
jgi:hypothetical protein